MKKLSRYISLLLILLMLASMAVSCKKGAADDEVGVAETGNGDSSGTEGGSGETGGDSADEDAAGGNGEHKKNQGATSTETVLNAMNAGKPCDIIYSNHVVHPFK